MRRKVEMFYDAKIASAILVIVAVVVLLAILFGN